MNNYTVKCHYNAAQYTHINAATEAEGKSYVDPTKDTHTSP